ncbi:hypothetical protein KIL84_003547 [Mauremys mutica]|uniref:Uncharacterized protein n=1 Tax=Mauremys mutica TaxID=74926 RepID=A0A9D3WU03_9SAUR|nr:hypothetical protein KIL84_003547 [Mauremys mutica]
MRPHSHQPLARQSWVKASEVPRLLDPGAELGKAGLGWRNDAEMLLPPPQLCCVSSRAGSSLPMQAKVSTALLMSSCGHRALGVSQEVVPVLCRDQNCPALQPSRAACPLTELVR